MTPSPAFKGEGERKYSFEQWVIMEGKAVGRRRKGLVSNLARSVFYLQ